ncbi:MAG: YneF family protein [Solobacterium sp.]|nr:YneF family protein [Solobacterium sp.]
MTAFWTSLAWFLAGAAISAVATFFLTKKHFEKELREHPPIDEKMIRAMFMQMGRKPSEAQIRQVMRNLKK